MDLKTLYREVILDHYKAPRNVTELDKPSRQADCRNPSCGDKIRVQLEITDGVLSNVAFIGNGCAISQASASMMTEAVKGRSIEEVNAVKGEFRKLIVEGQTDCDKSMLGDLTILEGVAKLHARVKCAMCGWSALEAALESDGADVNLDDDKAMPDSRKT